MVKIIELIVVLTLLIFAFFAGVEYSDSVKDHASWLFETKEEEVELPDLSDETINENSVVIDENGENFDASQAPAPQDAAPMDNIENSDQQPQVAPSISPSK
jgi:hypothetical protein